MGGGVCRLPGWPRGGLGLTVGWQVVAVASALVASVAYLARRLLRRQRRARGPDVTLSQLRKKRHP